MYKFVSWALWLSSLAAGLFGVVVVPHPTSLVALGYGLVIVVSAGVVSWMQSRQHRWWRCLYL